jgi:hypothetical protein
MQIVLGYTALSRILGGAVADLADLTLHLAQEALSITPATLTTDFTEATYDGYAAAAVADTGLIYLDAQGNVVWQPASVAFQPTGSTTPNTIYGWWLQGTVGGVGVKFVAGQMFDAPVAMAGTLDALFIDPQIPLGQPL